MMSERRKDGIYKLLLVIICGLSGSAGGWGGSKISQAELSRMMAQQGQAIQEVRAQMYVMERSKVDREDNLRADAAQDLRMADAMSQLEAIRRDQAEILRLLVQIQRGR